MTAPLGFLGLGTMGEPMALNLVRAGTEVMVWNRSASAANRLAEAGAKVAAAPGEVFAACPIVLMMLRNSEAIDATLGRGTDRFAAVLTGRTLVHMGTTSPEYSAALSADVAAAGGSYAEVPVSGSRGPAEAGKLVAMMAGQDAVLDRIEPLLAPMISGAVRCSAVPKALRMKLAANTYLVSLVTGLFEATNLARQGGLDLETFRDVLWDGPMACDVMRMKLPKLIAQDYAPQGSILNGLDNLSLMLGSGRSVGAAMPMTEAAERLWRDCAARGHLDDDMSAVLETYAALSEDRSDT